MNQSHDANVSQEQHVKIETYEEFKEYIIDKSILVDASRKAWCKFILHLFHQWM